MKNMERFRLGRAMWRSSDGTSKRVSSMNKRHLKNALKQVKEGRKGLSSPEARKSWMKLLKNEIDKR